MGKIWRCVFLCMIVLIVICSGVAPPVVYKVTTILAPPFTMIKNVSPTMTRYEGFLIDILEEVKEYLNIDFDIDLVVGGKYGSRTSDGNWSGLIGHLVRGEADIAAAPLSVVSHRAKAIEFTQQYMLSGPQILMMKSQSVQVSHFMMLLQPLSAGVWITALVAYVIVSLILYGIWRWSPFEWGSVDPSSAPEIRQSFNLKNSFFFTFSALMWQGNLSSPRSLSGRLLTAMWWIFTMFIIVAYTAALTGRFIIKATTATNEIRTFEDLAMSNLDYGIITGGKTSFLFRNSSNPIRQKMWQKMSTSSPSSFVSSTAEGVQRVRNSNGNFAFITETPLAEYHASKEPCDLVVTGEPLTDDGFAFACRKGSGICNDLDHALLTLKETARLHDLRRKWFGGVCAMEEDTKSVNPFVSVRTTLSLQDASFAFVLLAFGIVMSLAVFGLEIFLNGRGIVVPSSYKEDEMQIHNPSSAM